MRGEPSSVDTTAELPAGAASGTGGGVVLGRYRLGRRLGSGGFGTVFAAHDEKLRRAVAVKVIPASDGPGRDERSRREALAAARLDHPAIVAVFDAGEDDAARYLVSELVAGETLDRLSSSGALSDRDVIRIGLSLVGALAHARDRGVIHRDVKPQNVIVPDEPGDGRAAAKLTDFGVAHLAGDEPLTRTGDVVGTLAYMAPEQAAGEHVDDRVDLYAVALVLYEALAGANPVRAASPAATARRVGTVLPPLAKARQDLPEELCAALDRALRPAPEERGELEDLARGLAGALTDVSDEGGTLAPLAFENPHPRGLDRRLQRALAAVAAGALVALAAAQLRHPPLAPLPAAAATAAVVAVLPRLGWLAAAVAVVAALAPAHPGLAVLATVAALLVPPLLRRHGTAWSLPAAAPVLGLASLAGAYPALAGQARRAHVRAALGALGAAWALLGEAALRRALALGTHPPRSEAAVSAALRHAAWPLVTSGAVLLAVVWAAAAVVLPWIVRGRTIGIDLVAAGAWAAATAAATAALAERVAGPGARPPGLVPGALMGAAAAIWLARARARARDTVIAPMTRPTIPIGRP